MALRVVELMLPAEAWERSDLDLESSFRVRDLWSEDLRDDRRRIGVLMDAADTEPLLDELDRRFGDRDGYRVLLLPAEASLPRIEDGEEGEDAEEDGADDLPERISREELRAQLADGAEPTPVFLVMVALSALVCSFGLLAGDVAVIIGAMVIAPLLSPLVALSLAATLADRELAVRGLRAGTAGFGVAFVLSALLGLWLPVDPELPQIAVRSSPGLGHVGVALAAGTAGTLAFTTGLPAAVIGVMVAVALVPPLVAAGLLAGAGHFAAAAGATVLTLVNLICVNLAGVTTFLAQGIRPGRWWEAEEAKRSTRLAVAVWTVLLLVLVAVILFTPAGETFQISVGAAAG